MGSERFVVASACRTLAFVGVLASAFVVSCSSDPKLRPAEGSSDGSGGNSGGSSPSDAAVSDASSDGSNASCKDLGDDVLAGTVQVDAIAQSGDAPLGAGGTITDGTYALVDYTVYVGAGVPGLTGTVLRSVVVLDSGVLSQVIEQKSSGGTLDGGSSLGTSTSTFVTSGADFVLTEICPVPGRTTTLSYSATDTRLVWSNRTSGEVWTFERRP